MRRLIFIFAILFLVPVIHAQSLGPVVAEYSVKQGKTAKGSFKIQNDRTVPLAVVIEANTVKLDRTGPHYFPLDSSCQIDFQKSFRVSPKEIYEIPYRVTCSQPTAQIVLRAGIVSGDKTPQGVLVRIILPHVIYIGPSRHPREDALKPLGLWK